MITWISALLIYVPALIIAIRLLARAKRSRSWPKVEGTILESRVVDKGNAHEPRVTYTYTADGKSYVGHRITVGWTLATTGKSAERLVAAHAKGSRVAVAFDPADPSYSVLATGFQASHLMIAAFLAAFSVTGAFSALLDSGLVQQ
jgi:hypothetical protein